MPATAILRIRIVAFLFFLAFALSTSANAQTVSVIHNFKGTDGFDPQYGLLAQGRDGLLYGSTEGGGSYSMGTIFKQQIMGGSSTVDLHNFSGPDGAYPDGGLTLAKDGSFYGTTSGGGSYGVGVLFKMNSGGALTVLYNFTGGSDGGFPPSAPIEAIDANLYGVTSYTNSGISTLFRYTPSGVFSTLYTMNWIGAQGPPLQTQDGHLYVVSPAGGPYQCGAIQQFTTTGLLIHESDFTCDYVSPGLPNGQLYEGLDGYVYGTMRIGGTYGAGTIYRIDSELNMTTLYSFNSTTSDGIFPDGGVWQASDGNFYGTTGAGGTSNGGTLFRISGAGAYLKLYDFANQVRYSGSEPLAAPVQHTSGVFYGTTVVGGMGKDGTVYTLNMGLGPFITLVRSQGKVGWTIQILGQGFTGTTGVTFNGVPATIFNIVSDTYLTAVVPTGATTGPVAVSTPTGTLESNKSFRISP